MDVNSAKRMMSDLEIDQQSFLPKEVTKDELLKWIDDDEHGVETACGQELLPPDVVEHAIRGWIVKLEQLGYEPDDAQLAVFDSLAYLVDQEHLPDTPMMEASDKEKSDWISDFHEKIYARLIAVGIDFSEAESDEQVHSEDGHGMDS